MIGFTVNDFWNSSPIEVYMAIDGFSEFNGANEKEIPMDSSRLQELMELNPD